MGLTQKLGTIPLAIQTDSSNNVGIGITTPAERLEVFAPAVAGTSQQARLRITQGGSISARANLVSGVISGENPYFAIETRQSASPFNIVERLRIDGSGNVGIGTSSPNATLDVNTADGKIAGFNSSNANGGYMTWATSGTTIADIGTAAQIFGSGGNDTFGINARSTRNLVFGTANTERMRITSGGEVGIGMNPSSGNRFMIRGSSTSSSDTSLYVENSSSTRLFACRNDGAHFLSAFTYGNTVSGGTRSLYIDNSYALGGISSIRASKTNIESITNNDWIYQLEPVTFNYRKKDEEGNYTEEYFDEITYGLIAEDTAPIADFLINYNDKEDGTKEMVGIEYMRLITPMLKAIQELNAKVTALENK